GPRRGAGAGGATGGSPGGCPGRATTAGRPRPGPGPAWRRPPPYPRDSSRTLDSSAQARAARARRSITEHGDEVLTNIGASPGSPVDPASVPAIRPRYRDVREALRQAKEATRR